jgi:SAM-dependent methyltransferase
MKSNLHNCIPRELVAKSFLQGQGIEIGALHNPLKIDSEVIVKYVDHLDKKGLYQHYPELKEFNLVDVDIIDNGEKLETIKNSSQDFIIANHFIEHCQDPLSTIERFLEVLKEKGIIYMAVPDRRRTFDRDREGTRFSHLIEDRKIGPIWSKEFHYREWTTKVEPHFNRYLPGTPADVIDQRVQDLMNQKYSIHFHCWTSKEFLDTLVNAQEKLKFEFSIIFFAEYTENSENIFILKKGLM